MVVRQDWVRLGCMGGPGCKTTRGVDGCGPENVGHAPWGAVVWPLGGLPNGVPVVAVSTAEELGGGEGVDVVKCRRRALGRRSNLRGRRVLDAGPWVKTMALETIRRLGI